MDSAKEETYCLVAWADEDVVKKFVSAFYKYTGIPVSRVNYLVNGNWQIERFDE
jgi:hypothetical protein